MPNPADWSTDTANTLGSLKKALAHLSLKVRSQQFALYRQLLLPTVSTKILDVGVTPDEVLVDSNFFEKVYPYPNKLVVASVEDCKKIVSKFGLKKFVQLDPDKKYPFKDNQFDQVVSWATLEHVGSLEDQKKFIQELDRIGQAVFATTPYRFFPYELHTGWFLLHFLPKDIFRKILKKTGNTFWAEEKNLNLVSLSDARKICYDTNVEYQLFFSFGFLPTHIIFYKKSVSA